MNIQRCTLHKHPYEFFCEKCYEPVCKDCTYLGPHNTQIHRITQLSVAYEKRVNQVRDRIAFLMDRFRNKVLGFIDEEHHRIDILSNQTKAIQSENSKYMSKKIETLLKNYQNNTQQINQLKQQLQRELNQINDTGHQFETRTTDLQRVAEYQTILNQFKETIDRVQILLDRKCDMIALPKQQTDIRVAVRKVEALQELYLDKLRTLSDIFKLTDKDVRNFRAPTIPYDNLVKQLNENIVENSDHYVCHFCGSGFSYEKCNEICKANRVAMNVEYHKFQGYCQPSPESIRFGTHRHYFGKPKEYKNHFKNAQSSFKIHLDAILLKLRTLSHIHKVNIASEFKKNDKMGTGICQQIVMEYCLIQLCRIQDQDARILMKVCQTELNSGNYEFVRLLEMLEQFQVKI